MFFFQGYHDDDNLFFTAGTNITWQYREFTHHIFSNQIQLFRVCVCCSMGLGFMPEIKICIHTYIHLFESGSWLIER